MESEFAVSKVPERNVIGTPAPGRFATSLFLARLHIFTVLEQPKAIHFASGEIAIPPCLVSSVKCFSFCSKVAVSQREIEPSSKPTVATILPSGEKEQFWT